MARLLQVIETNERRGCGGPNTCPSSHEHEIIRHVRCYWSPEGELLAQVDPLVQVEKTIAAQDANQVADLQYQIRRLKLRLSEGIDHLRSYRPPIADHLSVENGDRWMALDVQEWVKVAEELVKEMRYVITFQALDDAQAGELFRQVQTLVDLTDAKLGIGASAMSGEFDPSLILWGLGGAIVGTIAGTVLSGVLAAWILRRWPL